MDDDALLSRTAALGLVARVNFGHDASYEVRCALTRAAAPTRLAAAAAATLLQPLQPYVRAGCNPASAYLQHVRVAWYTCQVLARRMRRMKRAAAERGAKPCTGLTMPPPPRAAAAATHGHEAPSTPHHAASRPAPLTAPLSAGSPRPPKPQEPTLHIPHDVLSHMKRADGSLLGTPPTAPTATALCWRLQPRVPGAHVHVVEAAPPTVKAAAAWGGVCTPCVLTAVRRPFHPIPRAMMHDA
jgi:hypothetical protein